MLNHNVAQAVFRTVIEAYLYSPDENDAYVSQFMCNAIKIGIRNGVVRQADGECALECIREYLQELSQGGHVKKVMRFALLDRELPNAYADRVNLYMNWLERPRYSEQPE